MKIQCSMCQLAAEAAVFCCADEAALCLGCDQNVHAANRVTGKHQRVPLSSSSSQMPNCDICQETVGYFFCLQDRALICRKCDVAVHTATPLASKHRRYLLTGVKVDIEATESGPSSSTGKNNNTKQVLEVEPRSVPKRIAPISSNRQHGKSEPVEASVGGDSSSPKSPSAGFSSTGNVSDWQSYEFIEFSDFAQGYGFMDNCSFKDVWNKTWYPKASDHVQTAKPWYVVDATDKILGRLASTIAIYIRGKNLATYTPSVDMGTFVIVVNADKVAVSGKKRTQKLYRRHSGRPGGMKVETFDQLQKRIPERIIEHAVRGMLPKGRLGRSLFNHLKVYTGPDHPHEAQKPKELPIRDKRITKQA